MKRPLHYFGAIVGIAIILTPAFVAAIGMIHAFAVLAKNKVSDPSALAGAVGEVLGWTITTLCLWPVGATLAAWSIVQLLGKPKSPPPLPRARPSAISDPHA